MSPTARMFGRIRANDTQALHTCPHMGTDRACLGQDSSCLFSGCYLRVSGQVAAVDSYLILSECLQTHQERIEQFDLFGMKVIARV